MYIERIKNLILNYFIKIYSNNQFVTFIKRPKKINILPPALLHTLDKNISTTAIIIQGPIIYKDNFTIETIKLYRQFYPKTMIILSTWKGVKSNFIKQISELNINLIQSIPPEKKGPFNINLQIVSTCNAIKFIENIDINFILKTRTDQRFYNINTLNYLHTLISKFHLPEQKVVQQSRIITCSMNTFKYRMYGISDMFLFGTFSDIKNYFNVNLDSREIINFNLKEKINLRDYANLNFCEIYLATNYLKFIGVELFWTLSDSLLKLKNHFCIIDQSTIDLYWGKYSMLEYRFKVYKEINLMEEITFNDWMLLQNNNNDLLHCNDEILDLIL